MTILSSPLVQRVDVSGTVQVHHQDVLSTLRLDLQVFDETRASLQRVVELLMQDMIFQPS